MNIANLALRDVAEWLCYVSENDYNLACGADPALVRRQLKAAR